MNRLAKELSPYLKAHSKNPVNWYPWSEEAFEIAKREDKPIFLSIGYNSCHWCHIMEMESFQNQEIAKILNENFISIKVDKEERPDIDKHFQDIFTQMNGKVGGWPLSIFLTPELLPIFSATYIPPQDNYGMIGFKKLLKIVSKKYKTQKDEIINSSKEIIQALLPKRKIKATKITKDLIKIALSQIKATFDSQNGGFGDAPKFPRVSILMLTINLYKLTKDRELLEIVTSSLEKMSLGGFYDLVDGGYCRYSVDERWFVPHFEKMLYDNGLMIDILVESYSITKDEKFLLLAKAAANFLISKMMSKDKLLFSSIDADSDGFEGGYYLFSYDEAKEAFEKADLPNELLDRLNIQKEGSLEGLNIVRVKDLKDLDDKDIKKALEVLKELRAKRAFPIIDKKIITSWSAIAIRALFKLSRVDNSYKIVAKELLEALRDYAGKGSRVYHCGVDGHPPYINGFLEDYAYLALANIEAYKTTLEDRYLKFAQDLINEAIKRFFRGGKWSLGDSEFRDFADDTDSSYPSAVGIIVDALLVIKNLKEPIYEKFIYKTLEAHSYDLMRQPVARAKLAEMAIRYLEDDKIIKSNLNNLKPLVEFIDSFSYPWIFLKADKTLNRFLVCNLQSCFAELNSIDEVREYF